MLARHAAALAFAGWYLMITSSRLPPNLSYKQPLRKWQIVRSFDDAEECQDSLDEFFEQSREKKSVDMLEPAYRDFMFAECVASDDPRLMTR